MSKYNGWTNYGTYKIKYQFFNSSNWVERMNDPSLVMEYADTLKEYLIFVLERDGMYTISFDLAMEFLNTVNFIEIAESLIKEYENDHI